MLLISAGYSEQRGDPPYPGCLGKFLPANQALRGSDRPLGDFAHASRNHPKREYRPCVANSYADRRARQGQAFHARQERQYRPIAVAQADLAERSRPALQRSAQLALQDLSAQTSPQAAAQRVQHSSRPHCSHTPQAKKPSSTKPHSSKFASCPPLRRRVAWIMRRGHDGFPRYGANIR